MGAIPTGQAVLQRVAAKLGVPEAADRLMIRRHMLYRYLDGEMPVPDDVLLKAVDLVLEDLQGMQPTPQKGAIESAKVT